jgi:hypothetical protein
VVGNSEGISTPCQFVLVFSSPGTNMDGNATNQDLARLAHHSFHLARILGLLKRLGVKIDGPIDRLYEQIKREPMRYVVKPLGLAGTKLDRVLFQNYEVILADLKLKALAHRPAVRGSPVIGGRAGPGPFLGPELFSWSLISLHQAWKLGR